MQTQNDDPYLLHQWILAGIASAAARFIPLPFVDDMVRTRSRQFAVARTLAAHDHEYSSSDLAPLYGGLSGSLTSKLLRKIASAPLKLALFPIRKLVKIFGSVRGVPLDLFETILVARSLDRCLDRGRFSPGSTPPQREAEAKRVRAAFDSAFDGIDWMAVKSITSDTMEQLKHWGGVTTRLAQEIFAKDKVEPERLSVREMENDAEVAAGAKKVHEMLDQPETTQLMQKFDERFDAALADSSPRSSKI